MHAQVITMQPQCLCQKGSSSSSEEMEIEARGVQECFT